MVRVLLAALLVCVIASDAAAGEKCRPLPKSVVVFWDAAGDVHSSGTWHRTLPTGEEAGMLSPAAYARFKDYADTGAKPARIIRCLDALIADEHGRKAKRACKVRARK